MAEVLLNGWFGDDWGAPICKITQKYPTPKNLLCIQCDRPIREGEQGIIMPFVSDGLSLCASHLDCHIEAIGPPEKRSS